MQRHRMIEYTLQAQWGEMGHSEEILDQIKTKMSRKKKLSSISAIKGLRLLCSFSFAASNADPSCKHPPLSFSRYLTS